MFFCFYNIKKATYYSKLLSWWLDQESNQGHEDFQSSALPTELSSLDNLIIHIILYYVKYFLYNFIYLFLIYLIIEEINLRLFFVTSSI